MNSSHYKSSAFLGVLFYLYYALLALLSFAFLYFEKEVWTYFTQYISSENAMGYFLYHAFCAITFFVSAILPLVVIQATPLPQNKWMILFMIFDAPVFILIDYLTGHKIVFAEIVMYDFVLELVAFTLADVFLIIKRKRSVITNVLIDIYSVALAFSFYGTSTFSQIKEAGIKSQLIFLFTLGSAVFGYYKVLKTKEIDVSKATDLQAKMSNVATVAMIATWLLMVYVYGKVLFFS